MKKTNRNKSKKLENYKTSINNQVIDSYLELIMLMEIEESETDVKLGRTIPHQKVKNISLVELLNF